jgi:hypothetical protein
LQILHDAESERDGGSTEEYMVHELAEMVEVLQCDLDAARERLEKLKARRDSLTGWWIAVDCDDGSLIIESHTGERRHVWQGGDEKLMRDLDAARETARKILLYVKSSGVRDLFRAQHPWLAPDSAQMAEGPEE